MSSYCSSSDCLNGNCPGCRNGSKYCNDPRCYPDCPDCSGETSINCTNKRSTWDWILLITVTVLAIVLLILIAWGLYGYSNDQSDMETDNQIKYSQNQQYYQTEYQVNYPETEYAQATYPSNEPNYQVPEYSEPNYSEPSNEPNYSNQIDSSLDVDVGMNETPMTNILPDVPPSVFTRTPTVSNAQMPPPPRPPALNDTTIRGF